VSSTLRPPLSYRDAGVDIDRGAALVDRIKPIANRTRRPEVMGGLGGFGSLFDLSASGYRQPVLLAATDGVGTKLKLAIATGRHDNIGIGLVVAVAADDVEQTLTVLYEQGEQAVSIGQIEPGTEAEARAIIQ